MIAWLQEVVVASWLVIKRIPLGRWMKCLGLGETFKRGVTDRVVLRFDEEGVPYGQF
jgi:hypothetical protein